MRDGVIQGGGEEGRVRDALIQGGGEEERKGEVEEGEMLSFWW